MTGMRILMAKIRGIADCLLDLLAAFLIDLARVFND